MKKVEGGGGEGVENYLQYTFPDTYHMDNESVEQNMLFEILHELY